MRRSGNREENKRIIMDLDVVLKSHDCPYIVKCYGTFITRVGNGVFLTFYVRVKVFHLIVIFPLRICNGVT